MTEEQKQLLHIIGTRLNIFGSIGKFTKPKFTKTGRLTKNRSFEYPHKNELLDMFISVKNNDYNATQIFNNVHAFDNEYYKTKKECMR